MENNDSSGPLLLTLQEVAERLNMSIRDVRGLIKVGAIPHISFGPRSNRVRLTDLLAYVDKLLT